MAFPNTFSSIYFPLLILLLRSIPAHTSPVQYDSQHAIAVNCGFPRNSTALNGRQWVGETDHSATIIFHGPESKSVSLFSVHNKLDPTPYMTARASRSSFTYTFHVGSGYKFIRLHFYPASYSGFKTSTAFITVKSGPYTLLNNFSAFLTADSLDLKSIVKEFTLFVPDDDEPLSITFSPSRAIPSDDETFAFVNGIEVVPMPPAGLYYTIEGDAGAYVVGQNYRLPIGKAIAMEMAHRLNVGGGSLTSAHDTSMFREWTGDSNHLIESNVFSITSSNRIKYTETSINGAPQRVYQSSWSMNRNTKVGEPVSFTWKLPVDLGFRYFIRLHFCELDYEVKASGQKEFSILINNQMVEPRGDLMEWGGELGVAIHKDYMVTVRGDRTMGKKDLFVALYPCDEDQSTEFIDAVLKGIEVFKLCNPDDNLAGVNPVISHPHATINHIPKIPTATTGRNYIATLVIIVITLLNVIVYQICEWRQQIWSKNNLSSLPDEELCRRFSFGEILSATNNFDKEFEIGHGGFGKVYKGVIDRKTKTVAIKRLGSESKQGEKEFRSEIEILSKNRHKHLVSLIGYCNEGREMILVYEYMEHGTLADHLHKNKRDGSINGQVTPPLSWEQRLNVCLDAANGLDYLHTNSEQDTIHRDVKSENILLDRDWVAKIADFGICKVGTTSNTWTHISTDVKGTIGYLDPQYFLNRRLTKKSDVYAFGVVLWEVLCGRPALDSKIDGEQRSLVLWVQSCFKLGIVDAIIDSSLRGQISTGSLKLYIDLANQCLHNQTNERPTMAEVAHGLESVLAAATSQCEEEVSDVTGDFGGSDGEYNGTDEIDLSRNSHPRSSISSISSGPLQLDDNNMQQKKKMTKHGNVFQRSFQALVRSMYVLRRKSSVVELDPRLEKVLRRFSLDEIRTATHNFINVIGMGGFVKCYKGMIDDGTTVVAIKEKRVAYQDFENELRIMSQINHHNVVNLIGYCNEKGRDMSNGLVVLEYMSNGSLYDHLHDKKQNRLPWKRRMEICIGVAQGLRYLHSEMSHESVIHRNVKSSNILLDNGWVAKVSDFDCALTARGSSTGVSSTLCGTIGYMDMEYCMTGRVSPKSDVYSFGMVLLEVLCAKTPDNLFKYSSELVSELESIVRYFRNIIQENRIDDVMDPYLVGKIAPECLIQYLRIATNCVEDKGIDRPSMEGVLSGLRNALELQEIWELDTPLAVPPSVAASKEWFNNNNRVAHNDPANFSQGVSSSTTEWIANFSQDVSSSTTEWITF